MERPQEIGNPYGEGRNPVDNYKTLISAIVPRPIGLFLQYPKLVNAI